MSQTKTKKPVPKVILAEDHFWKCYSPRGEFPVSTVISVVLHALGFGLVFLVGALAVGGGGLDGRGGGGPPQMDVVDVEGGGGVGGLGGEGFGKAGDGRGDSESNPGGINRQENVSEPTQVAGGPEIPKGLENDLPTELNPVTKQDIQLSSEGVEAPTDFVQSPFANLQVKAAQAARQVSAKAKTNSGANTKQPKKSDKPGSGSPGKGGGTGGGNGTGIGKGTGPGTGTRTTGNGRLWRVTFSAYANEPANFITKAFQRHQVMIAIPADAEKQRFYFANMSAGRPVAKLVTRSYLVRKNIKIGFQLIANNPRSRDEIAALVRAVRAPVRKLPQFVWCCFVSEKEEQLMRLARAKAGGVPDRKIAATHFDFQQSGNEVRPVVQSVVVRSR
ncbi:MAG: hypothetical protein ACFCD0_17515 [Gemmataceae bacterium]